MTDMTLGAINKQAEAKANVREFVALAKYLMLGGNTAKAAELAREAGPLAGPHVVNILQNTLEVSHKHLRATKAATAEGSISGWGSPLSNFNLLSNSFLNSLAQRLILALQMPDAEQTRHRSSVAAKHGRDGRDADGERSPRRPSHRSHQPP